VVTVLDSLANEIDNIKAPSNPYGELAWLVGPHKKSRFSGRRESKSTKTI
jgi:hypothetical protein